MRGKGFWIGSTLVVCMTLLSGIAFVETAHPVTGGPVNGAPGNLVCPTGARGIPSSCAEVHAAALASGAMTRSQYEFAQAGQSAMAAHAVTP